MVHIHNGILLLNINYLILNIKKNTFESVMMMWMNLEPIIQCEVSQKERNKNHI